MSDNEIDFSDIPELTDEEIRRGRRVGRPRLKNPKKLMAIRLSPQLIYSLKKIAEEEGKPYQTLIHELLEKATRKKAV